MSYEDGCGSCYWLRDIRSDSYFFDTNCYEKGHCIERGICPYPDDSQCSDYKNRETYSNSNYQAMKQQSSSGCFVTTIVCNILGEKDNCSILETLRKLRSKMQEDSKYKEVLYEYDTVGPKIAKEMEKDKEYDLINGMLDCYIIPAVYLTREEKYEEAVKKYVTMTRALENYYGIKYDSNIPNNYDQKNGGHGYVKTI